MDEVELRRAAAHMIDQHGDSADFWHCYSFKILGIVGF
jgi:hypothetical protein